jgi:DNA invertase Pin-like site-specific DNA recombinase
VDKDNELLGVAYYRVSSVRQGQSGLGLAAQRQIVQAFMEHRGILLQEFVEQASGRRDDRPVLAEALALCRKRKATLVLARLDRLFRRVSFVSRLLDTGVDFVCCEYPSKDKFWIQIQSAFAEEEARKISNRTKLALAAARARGVKLGETGKILAARHKQEAMTTARGLAPIVEELRDAGITTVRGVAASLNEREIASPGGTRWHYRSTWKLLKRLKIHRGN